MNFEKHLGQQVFKHRNLLQCCPSVASLENAVLFIPSSQ